MQNQFIKKLQIISQLLLLLVTNFSDLLLLFRRKEVTRKADPRASLVVETKAKKLGIVSSGIPFGQFRLSLRFLASSKTPTPLRHLNPLCEHVYKRNSTKRPSTNSMFDELVRSFEFCSSGLNLFSARSLADALVSPFRQKVTMNKRTLFNLNFEFNVKTEVPM